MSITIEQLQKSIQSARLQEANHRQSADACAGAAQAYEQLLSQLIQATRKEAADNAVAGAPTPGNGPVATLKAARKRK